MSAGRDVTAESLVPHGWVCEACGRPFRVGDNAYGVLEALTSDGTPIEGRWRCITCWSNDVQVPE